MSEYKGVAVLVLSGVYHGEEATLDGHAINGGCVLFASDPKLYQTAGVRLKMAEVAQLRDWLTQVIEKCQWDQAVADGAGRPPKE